MRKKIWILFLLVIPAILMPGQTARAGGPEDYLLLSEIKMKHLDQYAYRLDLSLAQWVTVLDLHQAYKKRYRTLRDVEIRHWFTFGIDREASTYEESLIVDAAFFDKLKYFRRKMTGFDGELFLKIESILTETQLERMPRVRDHRQRQFAYLYVSGIARPSWNYGVLDLGDIVRTMAMTRAEEAVIDPVLSEYERRLTPLARHVSEIGIDRHTNHLREMVRRGFGDDELGTHPAYLEVEHYLWSTPKGRRFLRLATQINTLTYNTAKALEQAFVDERREEWLDAYVKTAYPNFTPIRLYRRRVSESVDSITHISDDEQVFLVASVEEYERRMRNLLERNMAASDGYWTPRIPGTDEGVTDRWDLARAVWNTRTKELLAIRDWFRVQLEQGLGPAAFTQWDGTHTQLSTRPDWRPQHTSGQHVRMLYDSALCLSQRDVDQVLDRFDLDDETRAAVNTLMENYRSECRSVRTEKLEATNSGDGPLEARYIKRTLQRDAGLLESIKQTIDSDEVAVILNWLMPTRHRQQYARNLRRGGVIDPVTFLFDAKISTEHFGILAHQIDAYNSEVNPVYRLRYDSVVLNRLENPGENSTSEETYALNRRIAVINDRVMRSMTATLPELLGTGLLDTFLRTSHHYVYEARGRLHQVFQQPAMRESMTIDQRGQMEDLHANYISRYTELTDAMVALVIDADGWFYGDPGEPALIPYRKHEGIAEYIAEYAPLHIQRDDLNATTNVRIRTILTPQQVRAIGGLPDLK